MKPKKNPKEKEFNEKDMNTFKKMFFVLKSIGSQLKSKNQKKDTQFSEKK